MSPGKIDEKQLNLKDAVSDVARIEIQSKDPLDLFKEWHAEAKKYSSPTAHLLCLATVSKDLKVTARHLVLRDYDERGFVIVTDRRTQKCKDLADVPNAAMSMIWPYRNDSQKNISRQVRIEGKMEELSPAEFQYIYDREPLYCKIRSHLCRQSTPIDWDEQKIRHDKLFEETLAGKNNLAMPEHFVAYRMLPNMMEFYFAYDHFIGDRLLFKKETDEWTNQRIAA